MWNSCFRILASRMAPTVCVAEFPMTGTTVNALIRRRRRPESSVKRRRFALEEMLRTGTIVKTLLPPREHSSWRLDYADMVPNYSVREAEESGVHSMNVDESYRKLVAERRKGKKDRDIARYYALSRNYFRIFTNLQRLSREASRDLRDNCESNHWNEIYGNLLRCVTQKFAEKFSWFAQNWEDKAKK